MLILSGLFFIKSICIPWSKRCCFDLFHCLEWSWHTPPPLRVNKLHLCPQQVSFSLGSALTIQAIILMIGWDRLVRIMVGFALAGHNNGRICPDFSVYQARNGIRLRSRMLWLNYFSFFFLNHCFWLASVCLEGNILSLRARSWHHSCE